MSEKALDLRGSVRIVRRHMRLVSAVTALGLLAGGAYSVLRPPLLTSTALIVLPQSSRLPQMRLRPVLTALQVPTWRPRP